MRVSFLVYGVLYVAFEIVGHHLETVGWPRITPLDVASALTDALLVIVICIALLVGFDVARQKWGPALRAWNTERLRLAAEAELEGSWAEVTWDDDEPIGVRSWRSEPLALPAPAAGATFYTPSTYGPPFPEEPGPQI
ncbi:hypothetical protein [Blastococcus sp. CT_GayMR16]|uniref:hypothetical protein n=1 Tax=Blastococcus sp. CT_GayMR16 TaxID=2559607 RepID=UPI0010749B81|nr:hypothetical protein [Blastococcus sp. CT_GayMR16]TFV88545.1 hypothetical protein E4P38_10260 [Blastococcus sp. CT_GayMR16]